LILKETLYWVSKDWIIEGKIGVYLVHEKIIRFAFYFANNFKSSTFFYTLFR